MSDAIAPSTANSKPALSALWIALLFVILAAIRIAAVSDLHEGDQPKQADYVLDIVCNGNWIVQHHADGSIMSKPPLYNWLAAPLVMLFGPDDVWLKMPSLLAGLTTALMLWDLARRKLGDRAAYWGSAFLLLTSMFEKQMYYARTDMLLTCFIVMQFWALERFDETDAAEAPSPRRHSYHSPWIWIFWLAAALGNLTKGPLAFLPHLAYSALWLYQGRFKQHYARLGLWWGLPLAFVPLLLWFLFAFQKEGYAIYEHMVKAEVVARFQSDAERAALKGTDKSNRSPIYYIPHIIARTAPWSLFALLGIWSVFTAKKNPDISVRQRNMLYLLAAWFFTTLLFFSLVPSKRPDRIFPAIPAFCLLAGWVFDGFLKSMEGTGAKLAEHRIVGWIVVATGMLFIVLSFGLMGFEFEADFGPFKWLKKLPPLFIENLTLRRALALVSASGLFFGGKELIAANFRHYKLRSVTNAIGSYILVVALYQFVFASWLLTDFSRGAPQVCQTVRTQARTENARIMVIAGSGPAARFYLLKAGLETPAKDAADLLAKPHPAIYVVATYPSFDGKKRKPGGLEDAGLGALKPLKIEGIPEYDSTQSKLPSIPWLGAVFVPEKK